MGREIAYSEERVTMIITVESENREMVISKEEYDLLREKASLFNQVCAIQRKRLEGGYDYEWNYTGALSNLLDDIIKSEMLNKGEEDE
jgi:hypothetical protein